MRRTCVKVAQGFLCTLKFFDFLIFVILQLVLAILVPVPCCTTTSSFILKHTGPAITFILLIASPLATLAFKKCAVGDTGLTTGWVRCRHGAGGAGRGGGHRGINVSLSPWVGLCVGLGTTTPRGYLGTLSLAKCTQREQKAHFTLIRL